jgi:hypothetical protein
MARLASVALGALIATASPAYAAPPLPRLHIIAMGQHADRQSVAPHEQFHVTIRLVVAEKRNRFDELILGDCSDCSIVGDERIPRAVPAGTEYIERLTIEATAPGEAVISPAYIDAIDPANGKALRYSTDPVRVRVTGDAPSDGGVFYPSARSLLTRLLEVIGVMLAVVVLIALVAIRMSRRKPPSAPIPPTVRPAAPPPASGIMLRERIARAADACRITTGERETIALRALLLEAAGVSRGATLVDALRALPPGARDLRAALLAAERAIFGPASEHASALDDLLAAVDAWLRTPSNEGV